MNGPSQPNPSASAPLRRDGAAATAEALSARPPAGFLAQPMILIALAAAIGVLTANLWLMARLSEQRANATREHYFWVLCQAGYSPAERVGAFRALVAEGNKEWRSAQLSGLNLEGISLPGTELNGAGFLRANLAKANLARAKISQASLELADVSGADLSEADLSETRLYRAVLKETKLQRANLRAAVLQEARGENADLMVADLSEADCLMANLAGANLSGANFTGARLEGANLKGARLSLARFDGANLKDADFTNSDWWRARGLTTAQLKALRKNFAPSNGAALAVREDYQKWAMKLSGSPP